MSRSRHTEAQMIAALKQLVPLLRRGRTGELRIARGRLGGANEASEVVDVGETVRPGRVVRLGRRVAQFRYLVGLEAASDAHFVEIRVGSER